jgi:dihydrofolate synthase/folylpolyglutamate synthase
MVYGSMRDKAVEEITGTLFPLAHHILVTAPPLSRALRPQALRDLWAGQEFRTTPDLRQALAVVRAEARPSDAVFITGSLFVVGEARALLVQ